jgi:predicted RNA-binding protein with PIN domain
MQNCVVIDGYNLIFHFPDLRKWMERDLEGARNELIRRVGSYAFSKRCEFILVFDGDSRHSQVQSVKSNVKVLFSRHPEKADTLIKRLIDQQSKKKRLLIVTSDTEIANYAKLYGCSVQAARHFVKLVLRLPDEPIDQKYESDMDPEELEEWIRLFKKSAGTIDEGW